tara:strand:- start:24364 stop:25407 length:1044 start_codon:yes stop_codon:yes gene_type:complete
MATTVLDRPYESPAAWVGPELAPSSDWIYVLTDADIAELDTALRQVNDAGLEVPNINRVDFPLPNFSKTLANILQEIEYGRGFKLIRGLPVERLGEKDATKIYWGIGTHFGEAVAQNMMGELLGHVKAVGSNWDQNFNLRGYQTPVHLPYHCDKSDTVGLLCMQTAKSGGLSSIASSIAIHNEILRSRPDLLPELYKPFYVDHRGEEFDGEAPYYIAQVFSVHNGRFFARFGQKYVESAQRFPEVPRLSKKQTEAMNLFSELALSEEIRLDMEFERGDMQFLNNHYIVHSRTEYEDFEEEERRRHLIRMLLFTPSYEDVPKYTADLNAFIRRWGDEPRASVLSAENG